MNENNDELLQSDIRCICGRIQRVTAGRPKRCQCGCMVELAVDAFQATPIAHKPGDVPVDSWRYPKPKTERSRWTTPEGNGRWYKAGKR